jgi:hypothetical protein
MASDLMKLCASPQSAVEYFVRGTVPELYQLLSSDMLIGERWAEAEGCCLDLDVGEEEERVASSASEEGEDRSLGLPCARLRAKGLMPGRTVPGLVRLEGGEGV